MSDLRFEEVAEGARLIGEVRGDDQLWLTVEGDRRLWPELYARGCDRWVRDGYVAHQVDVPADDGEQLDLWYGLAFGRQQVYASRPLEPARYDGPVHVRSGDDIETALTLSGVLFDHLHGPPVWSGVPERPEEEVRRDWTEFLAESQTAHFVAELDGTAVAHLVLADEGVPGATELAVAATLPEARGRGAMHALWSAATAWALEQGYERCDTDWRSTNLEAARCWTALGFLPTRYRLHRLVGH